MENIKNQRSVRPTAINRMHHFCVTFINANYRELLAVLVVFGYFYYLLVNSGIATHDDLASIAMYKCISLSELYGQANYSRWGGTVMGLLPVWLQINLSDNLYIWQLFSIIGLIIACFTGFHIIHRHIDKKMAWSALMLFIVWAQFSDQQSGLYAFGWVHRYQIAWMFVAIDLYLFYVKTHKKFYYVSSAVFYLLASMQYEAFIVFGILLFAIDIFYNKDGRVSFRRLFNDLWLHAVLVGAYAMSWIIVKNVIYHSTNTDATLGTSYSLRERIRCLFGYSFALFPLRHNTMQWKDFIHQWLSMDIQGFFFSFFFIVMSIVIVNTITQIKVEMSLKRYIGISVLCLLGCLLSNVLLCMTDRFIRWMLEEGTKEWGPSYFSYFFIILWITVTIRFFCQIRQLRHLTKIIIFIVITLISQMTYLNNVKYIENYAISEIKYELTYNLVMHTDFFKTVEGNAQIYMPEYFGIHGSMDVIANFANRMNHSSVVMTNKMGALDFARPVYEIKIDNDAEALYIGKINNEFTTDLVRVYSMDNNNHYTATAERASDTYGALDINGVGYGMYGHYIIAPNITCTDSWMSMSCDSIIFDTFSLTDGNVPFENMPFGSLNKIINLSGDGWNGTDYINYGISHNEGGFTWSDGNVIDFRPLYLGETPHIVTLDYSMIFQSQQRIKIFVNDSMIYEDIITEPGRITARIPADMNGFVNLKIELPDAISLYKLYESGAVQAPEDWQVSGDRRYLGLALTRIAIEEEK